MVCDLPRRRKDDRVQSPHYASNARQAALTLTKIRTSTYVSYLPTVEKPSFDDTTWNCISGRLDRRALLHRLRKNNGHTIAVYDGIASLRNWIQQKRDQLAAPLFLTIPMEWEAISLQSESVSGWIALQRFWAG